MTETAQMEALREALLGANHKAMYRTNPSFRMSVDALATMLPSMVAGLADRAKHDDPTKPAPFSR